MKRLSAVVLAAGAVAVIAGCGGGGGGSSLSGGSRAAVFLTDSFREDFGHVWATIYRVEIVPQSGAPVVLFDDPAGHQIDLRTLRDASGARFSFLGSATIPAGTYTGLNVTVGPTMQLFRAGVAVGNPIPVDPTIPKDANGNPILSLTFHSPKTIGSTTNTLVIDFDLAHFVIRASGILPSLQEGDSNGPNDQNRHNIDDYHGVVSNLSGTSPALTFTLTRGNGQAVTVVTSASTALFGSTDLANGSVVNVEGTVDATTQNLLASEIRVLPAGAPPHEGEHEITPEVTGTASNLDATAGTFTLTIVRAHGFTPSQTTVNVVTNGSTMFHSNGGATATQADFFTALATAPAVEVEGTYDATSNTITATNAKIEDPTHDEYGGGDHGFRPGVDDSNWGHGVFHDHGNH